LQATEYGLLIYIQESVKKGSKEIKKKPLPELGKGQAE
jgi:hypothetical protein